ncbi:hypothetical protein A0H81_02617 [Grifola frondosa]|uniref:Major facilitator superfamily (MFS) profile domain-containing protein n=1 Tax=Grifola frondosa TaxID=5627 RepID=A0A1C7MS27_GRIFR|nr:hypothetical protein A0H81_02617 [Grifola frondosa]
MNLRDSLITATVCCVTVLSIFVSGATTVAITTIGKDLSFKQPDLQWPLNVFSQVFSSYYMVVIDVSAQAVLRLLAAAVRKSRRYHWEPKSLSVGVGMVRDLPSRSLATAFAPNPQSFIVFIGMQGIGAAANTPAGISIISSHFPAGKDKNMAFAILGAGQPIGFISGMIIGGLLSQSAATWRTIFWLQAGLGLSLSILGWFVCPDVNVSRRYSKGLDWIGAILSTGGIGLLTYDLAESTAAPRGWATPFVPSLFGTSIVLIISFVLWEMRREARGESVLVPMSMWSQPRAKMGPILALVVFGWWAFNTLSYFAALFYEQVLGLGPLQTALRLVAMGCSGFITNVITGYVIGLVPGQILVLIGLGSCMASCIIFALINVHASYWAMAFIVMITLPVLDLAYTVANMQVCFSFDADSQALAGGMFSVATRLGTSLGLAITSSIANSVSQKYNGIHPELAATDPSVLMAGFRAAGWTCCGASAISFLIAVIGMRGVGIIGQEKGDQEAKKTDCSDVELAQLPEAPVTQEPIAMAKQSSDSICCSDRRASEKSISEEHGN